IFVSEVDELTRAASAAGGTGAVQCTTGALTVASASGDGVTLSAGGAGNGIVLNGAVDAGAGDASLTALGAITGNGQVSANTLTVARTSVGEGRRAEHAEGGVIETKSTSRG